MVPIDVSSLAMLSRSDRLDALSRTGLIQPWSDGNDRDGLTVLNGEIIPNNIRNEWKIPFPRELLDAQDPVGANAKEILLSKNRIVLEGDQKKSLEFLKSMGEFVQHIKTLDIVFTEEIFDAWPPPEYSVQKDWQELSEYIAGKLKLEELDLTLDAGEIYESWMLMSCREEDIPYVRDIHAEIIDILATTLKGKKPKAFYVFWAAFHDQESLGEKRLMGDDYDTAALGKIPPEQRSYGFPHGVPDGTTGWSIGMNLT